MTTSPKKKPVKLTVVRSGALTTCSAFISKMHRGRSDDYVFVCSFANNRDETGKFPPRDDVVSLSQPDWAEQIEKFLKKNDAPGRAVYVAVNPVRGSVRNKTQIAMINDLHTELDFKGIIEDEAAIRSVLRRLKYPPSVVVFSGHGLHCYWLLAEPIGPEQTGKPLGPEQIATHEIMLRRLTEVLAGDVSAAEAARVLRLPGSHNSKFGNEWLDVVVIEELTNWKTYKVEDLDEWLTGVRPLLTYKKTKADE